MAPPPPHTCLTLLEHSRTIVAIPSLRSLATPFALLSEHFQLASLHLNRILQVYSRPSFVKLHTYAQQLLQVGVGLINVHYADVAPPYIFKDRIKNIANDYVIKLNGG